ncbi:MAG TPA: trypsin-like peptidase domain-containing protein [Myxococcaceae bacterium]|nr:trypsin-like peptidase domain-containing protein [Myxococcaceae bacterium]
MSASWNELSEGLAGVVEAQGSSVVRVEARRRWPSSGVVLSADGLIAIAQHTVEGDEEIEVGFADGKTAPAKLVGRDPGSDLALLKADATALHPVSWADGAALKVGHLVLAVARPGRGPRATLGIVSALGDGFRTPTGGQVDRYLQTDLALQPGFSGSLLATVSGEVLGLNTGGLMRGVSLAIPAETVRRVTDSLLQHGRVRRGFLGVGTQPVRLPEALAAQAGQGSGLLVISVQPDGPSYQAGVLLGDVLLSLDGKPLSRVEELLELLGEDRIGAEVTARLNRAGQTVEARVTLGVRP